MTISISNRVLFLMFILVVGIVARPSQLLAFPPSTVRVPQDSFLVVSLEMDALLKKSNIKESKVWRPIIDAFNLSLPEIKSLFLQPDSNGFNLRSPVQVFLRTSNSEKKPLTFGLLATVDNANQIDQLIANFAESLGFAKRKGKAIRYEKKRRANRVRAEGKGLPPHRSRTYYA